MPRELAAGLMLQAAVRFTFHVAEDEANGRQVVDAMVEEIVCEMTDKAARN